MKKFLAVLLIICIAFAGFITWKNYTPAEKPAEPAEAPLPEESVQSTIDYDALYAAYEPDRVVMTVGGEPVTWDEYYYYLSANVSYLEGMFMYYGTPVDWSIVADEQSGETVGDSMWTMAKDGVAQLRACTRFAQENGAVLTAEQEALIAENLKSVIERACGEGASEEDFNEYLKSVHATRELYDMMSRWDYLNEACFVELYGENAEKISDEDAQAYIDEMNYARLNHILFMTMDISTQQQKDEAFCAAKQEAAQALYEELAAIENDEERVALFNERKVELDEDTGKTDYPNGYIATPNAGFVKEFLDGGYALENYQVSEPIKSDYGYHVMLRLPVTPDTVLDDTTGETARMALANLRYNEVLTAYIESMNAEYTEEFKTLNLTDFLVAA